MRKIKNFIIKRIEAFCLVKKHWKAYYRYYASNKTRFYKCFKAHGITHIRPTSKNNWKLWYGTCYFAGEVKNEKVFIKVQSSLLRDCFDNEKKLNLYIDETSEFLSRRKPKLFMDFVLDDYYILVFEHVDISDVEKESTLTEFVQMALDEYSRIGVIHTDFGLVNIGNNKGVIYFLDYGTSLCLQSDRIRIRNSVFYNHLDKILPQAQSLVAEPDFYYDDAAHCGLSGLERKNVNFLVGKNDIYYAKLGEKIYKYHLEKKSENSVVRLLCKDDEL